VEELTLANERLQCENKALRGYKADAQALRGELCELKGTMESRISKAIEESIAKATEPLIAKIEEQQKEILRLKAIINRDSSNSSKPPSANGFKKVPNNRETSGKKQGGQAGHKGNRLNIAENLEELVKEGKAEHTVVLDGVSGDAPYVSDWEIDLKAIPVYIERRRPVGLPPRISYGRNFQVLAVYLSVIGLVSVKRLSEFFGELTYGMAKISKATLAKFTRDASHAVDIELMVEDLLNGEVIHTDETPIKTTERPDKGGKLENAEKTTFNAYIRTYSNGMTTVLTANPRKTEESVISDNILTRFHGIISHDHEAKFYNFGDRHATCGAHLSRELKGMAVLQLLDWAVEFRCFYVGMNAHKNDEVRLGAAACEPALLCQFEQCYDEFVSSGACLLRSMEPKSFGYDELRRMVSRLQDNKDNYMLFIRDYSAPFTNNQAERDLRHCKTKQKISGCFRSWQGVVDYCRLRSFFASAQKRGHNLLLALFSLLSKPLPAGQ
jgi:transposase